MLHSLIPPLFIHVGAILISKFMQYYINKSKRKGSGDKATGRHYYLPHCYNCQLKVSENLLPTVIVTN